jgi:inorganic pyrophosphatase
MNLNALSVGKNPPEIVNVVIEIAQGSGAVKYEIDKDSGALLVDRFLGTAMYYPANYGFIPHTLGGDGDPLDVLVLTQAPLLAGSVVSARLVGVLQMEDEKGRDEKLIAVPTSKLTPLYDGIKTHADLPPLFCQQVQHFFEHYKDLEKGKWVKILSWDGPDVAQSLVTDAMKRFQENL